MIIYSDKNVKSITSYDGYSIQELSEITSTGKNNTKKKEPEYNIHQEIGLELGVIKEIKKEKDENSK